MEKGLRGLFPQEFDWNMTWIWYNISSAPTVTLQDITPNYSQLPDSAFQWVLVQNS